MKKLRLKKKAKQMLIKFAIVLVIIIIVIVFGVSKYKEYKYHQTYEYKLLTKEYSKDEVNNILSILDEEYINKLLEKDYDKNINKFITQKYFIKNNLDRYLEYIDKHIDIEPSKVVALVNTNRDRDYYSDVINSDVSKDILMLVNKYYRLNEDYVPNVVNISSTYAYSGNYAREDVLSAFISMRNDCLDATGKKLIVNSSYRSYSDQDEVWSERKNRKGIEQADSYAARPGHSEHQSGLALDIVEYNNPNDFEETESFKWMQENAHKYGFILRYPSDAEDITGYSYESWHYRFVGVDVATKVHNESITYDEYYAYYIENR